MPSLLYAYHMLSNRMEKLGVDFPFFVAPMVGISHVAFRELIRHYTPESVRPILFTEMLSTRRIPNERLDQVESLRCSENESHFIPQLLGNEERFILPSIKKLLTKNPWGFDINMGCPVKKTLAHNWGVLLMGDKNYAAEVVKITKRASPLPVSVKMRASLGDQVDFNYLVEFTDSLEKAGANWITIHGRAKGQKHRGEPRMDLVEQVSKIRGIPVIANGDIQTSSDVFNLLDKHQFDGLMVGRAAIARPWLLWQIAFKMGVKDSPKAFLDFPPPLTPEEEGQEFFKAASLYSQLLEKYFGDSPITQHRLCFFLALGGLWMPFGHSLWKNVNRTKTLAEARTLIEQFGIDHPQKMSPRVQL